MSHISVCKNNENNNTNLLNFLDKYNSEKYEKKRELFYNKLILRKDLNFNEQKKISRIFQKIEINNDDYSIFSFSNNEEIISEENIINNFENSIIQTNLSPEFAKIKKLKIMSFNEKIENLKQKSKSLSNFREFFKNEDKKTINHKSTVYFIQY